MFNFKSQLVSFGKYRYAQIESQLPLISNPRKRNFSLVWISTPVAAVVGLLVGLSINFCGSDMKKNENMVEVKRIRDDGTFAYDFYKVPVHEIDFESLTEI